jgi:hypothetical protein
MIHAIVPNSALHLELHPTKLVGTDNCGSCLRFYARRDLSLVYAPNPTP